MTESEYANRHAVLTAYLRAKTDEGDWHGVSDAANDLRVLEAHKPYLVVEYPMEIKQEPNLHQFRPIEELVRNPGANTWL